MSRRYEAQSSKNSNMAKLVLAVLIACTPALIVNEAAIGQTNKTTSPAKTTDSTDSVLKPNSGQFFQQQPDVQVPAKPVITQPSSRLAVVRNGQSSWGEIVETLDGVKYTTIALDNLSAASLENVDVLFLPNLNAMTTAQVKVLNDWINAGGYVIATGTIGSAAQPEARMNLRSLIGGYWSSDLSKSSHVLPRTSPEYYWAQQVPEISSQKINTGGVLSPTLTTTRTVAFWPDNRIAALQTNHSLYLGWQWGNAQDRQEYDRMWLLSALSNQHNQYNQQNQVASSDRPESALTSANPLSPTPETETRTENTPTRKQAISNPTNVPVNPTDSTSTRSTSSSSTAANPVTNNPTASTRTSSDRSRSSQAQINNRASRAANPTTRKSATSPATPPSRSPNEPVNRPSPTPTVTTAKPTDRSRTRHPLSTRPSPNLSNRNRPAQPTAPVARVIEPPAPSVPVLPVNTLEAISMRRELKEIMGRVENAIISAEIAKGSKGDIDTSKIREIAAADELLKEMSSLVQSGKHTEVRSRYRQVRQDLLSGYPDGFFTPLSEVRAIWLDRGTIVAAGSEQGLAQVFDRMAEAGVNTVFVETINAGYPIYPSGIAPQQNPLTRGWDPLAASVKLAHERNMELHAWVWVFGVGNKRHNPLVGKPVSYPGPVLEVYPQWANKNSRGGIFAPEGKTFLDPANPQVQNYLVSLYREIATRYDVDGLHLDYIRQPRQDPGHNFGYGTVARQKFQALTGVDPVSINQNNRSLWWMWTEFRTQQVSQFVNLVSTEMDQVRPEIVISAAVFPFERVQRISRLQQNWEDWVARGDIDLLVPMTYEQDTTRFLQQRVQPALSGVARSPVLFLPGVMIKGLDDIELLDQLQAVRDLPSGGYSLFAAEYLSPSFRTILARSKATAENQIVPYRKPFAAAESRYAALEQEWQSLLASDRLWVRGESLTNWQEQSEQLSQALAELSAQPSAERLDVAMEALDVMIVNMPDWMRLENLRKPYLVNTWANRLASIDTILRYGDRTYFNKMQVTDHQAEPTNRGVDLSKAEPAIVEAEL
ncbi:protein of unknown function DUF187 [Thalassoporum mexicanum PCC 7367]|uniref:family 10 glycosylhydrolase n=1 Tax=Thalassoporum mexicanum TaxID=3457544 RepID=UPI00029F94D6|nr:family 10 glycosylhydrolase [Pseudanabaena sp. PCC 7367]AFY71633.1 protein of unknown function DUF187 [Pseudanabaena sp. PCC 7367]